ncbi:hypothetical protein [Streptacidiphilus sp. MAP5-52]|uniref:hypothetical protein n=1 Tax=Streptacidiphilus sp. MAP5-52 TaxID=3156267 RepID=UPI0035199D3C
MDDVSAFWNAEPYFEDPTEDEGKQLRTELLAVAQKLAAQVCPRTRDLPEGDRTRQTLLVARPGQLALLRVLRELAPAAEELATEVAFRAGTNGANYRELGAAWGITRQSARKKWPDAMRSAPPEETTGFEIEIGGGEARIIFNREIPGWTWTATGADALQGGSRVASLTSQEASGHAGAWLQEHSATAR